MADKVKKIYELNMDTSQFTKEMAKTKQTLDELKLKQAEVKELSGENSKEYQELSVRIANVNRAYREQKKVTQDVVEYGKQDLGYKQKLKKELRDLQRETDTLTKEQLENVNIGGKMLSRQKEITDELKRFESAAGSNTRNVGNYTDAMSGLGSMVKGRVTTAFKTFGAALKAHPILFIIGIITSAIAFMKKALKPFQPLLDWISDKLAYVSGLIDGFTANISKMGEIIAAVFLGNMAGAAEVAGELGENMKAAAEAQEYYNRVLRETKIQQLQNNLTSAETLIKQAELKKIFDDASKSAKERTKALAEYNKILKSEAIDDFKNKQKEVISLLWKELTSIRDLSAADAKMYANKVKSMGLTNSYLEMLRRETNITDEQYETLSVAFENLTQLKAKSYEVDAQAARRQGTLNNQLITEEKRRAKSVIDVINKSKEENRTARKEQLEQEQKQSEALRKILNERNKEVVNDTKETSNKIAQIAKNRSEQEIQNLQEKNTEEKAIFDVEFERKKEREQKLAEVKKAIRTESFNYAKSLLNAFAESERIDSENRIKELQAERNAKLKNENLTEEQKKSINEKYDALEEAEKKRQFNREKKTKKSQIWIEAAQAVIGTWSGYSNMGVVGAVLAGVQSALILGLAAKQVSNVDKQKFAKGGVIGGKPHSQGGTTFVGDDGSTFEAERGEAMFVLNKRATDKINALSDLNEAYGGVSFGNKSSYLANGGQVSTRSETLESEQANTINAMRAAFKDMPNPQVSVVDIIDANSSYNTVTDRNIF